MVAGQHDQEMISNIHDQYDMYDEPTIGNRCPCVQVEARCN